MLAADKLQLQSALKQQATALKEKEFNLHHSNLMTVGTQAAVLAGLDITMFIEFSAPDDDRWPSEYVNVARALRCAYFGVIVGAFCCNMLVVSHTTVLSVMGAGLALRGPDGSMMTASDGLYEERQSVFKVFGYGLAMTVGSVLLSVWLLLRWEAALICWLVTLLTCRKMYTNYKRVMRKFGFDENDTVDFKDIMDGPAAIRGVPWRYDKMKRKKGALQKSPISTPVGWGVGWGSTPVSLGHDPSETSYSETTDMELQEVYPLINGRNVKHRRAKTTSRVSPTASHSPQSPKGDFIQTV